MLISSVAPVPLLLLLLALLLVVLGVFVQVLEVTLLLLVDLLSGLEFSLGVISGVIVGVIIVTSAVLTPFVLQNINKMIKNHVQHPDFNFYKYLNRKNNVHVYYICVSY